MSRDVFISHSSVDALAAQAICRELERQGITCWLAARDVPPASAYPEEIVSAIEGARVLLLVFSGHSNTSAHVLRELDRAAANGIPMLPVRIDGSLPTGGMAYFLCMSQWFDASTGQLESHLGGLAAAVRGAMDGPRPGQRPSLGFIQPPVHEDPPDSRAFVGRETELQQYARQLDETGSVLLTGAPGVGKSSLAAALARQRAASHAIFWHTFRAGEGDTIVTRLAGFLYWLGHEDLWRMLQIAGNDSLVKPTDLHLDYLVQALREAAIVVCLDDFQHVERNSFVEQLVRRLRGLEGPRKLLLILTARKVPPFLHDLHSAPLQGLAAADALLLLQMRAPRLQPALARRLCDRTEGVPVFLQLALGVLEHSSDPQGLIEELEQAPNVAGYLLDQVDQCLADPERETMIALAVLEDPTSRDAIEAVMDGRRVQPSLELLEQNNLIKAIGFGPRKYLQHPLLQAYYEGKPSRRQKQEMLRRAGEYYDDVEPDPLRAADYFERAGERERAARLAIDHGWETVNQGRAGRLCDLLARFRPGQLPPEPWAGVNIALGETLAFQREVDGAAERFEAALEVLEEPGDTATVSLLRARAYRGMAELLRSSEPGAAIDWATRGLDELAAYEPDGVKGEGIPRSLRTAVAREAAALRIDAGMACINEARFSEARELLSAGLAQLPATRDPLKAAALINLGIAHCTQGNVEEGKRCYREALGIAERTGDQWRAVSARHNLGIEMEIGGDWMGAAAEYEQALELAEHLGSRTPQTGLMGSLGIVQMKLGNLEEAEAYLCAAVDMARAYELGRHLAASGSSLADLLLRMGRGGDAATLLAEAESKAGEMDAGDLLAEIERNWALVWLARGDLGACLAAAERSLEWARKAEVEFEEAVTLRVQGQALSASGQRQEANAAFERSLSLLVRHDPYEAARTKVEWATSRLAAGDLAGGQGLLAEAEAEFVRLGATWDSRRVRGLLQHPA